MNIITETCAGPVELSAEAVITGGDANGKYWRIQYALAGETVYACSSKRLPVGVVPGVVEALSWKRRVKREGREVVASNRELLIDALGELAETKGGGL
jgi:hypothetical protein